MDKNKNYIIFSFAMKIVVKNLMNNNSYLYLNCLNLSFDVGLRLCFLVGGGG